MLNISTYIACLAPHLTILRIRNDISVADIVADILNC